MKILIVAPSLNIHGGIRVLVEWANHLSKRGHKVTLQVENGPVLPPNNWIEINERVKMLSGPGWLISLFDVAVASTPSIALRMDYQFGAKKFFLLQMAEDLFAPNNKGYVAQCLQSYNVEMPIIGISRWVESYVMEKGRKGPMYYIGNGVSDHFKPGKKDEELTILAEGWEGYNPAKDTDQLTAKAAEWLKSKYGAKILAYSQFPISHHKDTPDEYYTAPGTEMIKSLYQRAHFMIKATRYDARSCAPVEAMKCGTPTVRAIDKGDDDLVHMHNCLKSEYALFPFLANCRLLIEDKSVYKDLVRAGTTYAKVQLNWNHWMEKVETIFNES